MFHPDYINPKKLINNDDILQLFNLVEKHGGVLRFVGGAVRDAIAGLDRTDIDMVTDMSPSEFRICAMMKASDVSLSVYNFLQSALLSMTVFQGYIIKYRGGQRQRRMEE